MVDGPPASRRNESKPDYAEEAESEKEEEEEVPQFDKWVAYGPAKRAFFVGFR